MSNHLKGIVLVLSSTVMWGLVGVLVQYLTGTCHFTPEWLVNVRLIIGGLILLVVTYFFYEKDIFYIFKNNIKGLLILGIIGLLGSQYGFYLSVAHSNAPTATILVFLLPVFTVLYTLIIKHKMPSGIETIAIILAAIGTTLIVTKGDFSRIQLSPIALFAGVSSAICCVVYTIQPRKMLATYPATAVIGWGMLFGGIVMSFFSDIQDVGVINIYSISSIFIMIIFGTIIAFCFYLKSLLYISPTEASILTVGEPLASIFFSVILLGVSFSFIEMIGAILILSTVFILALAK